MRKKNPLPHNLCLLLLSGAIVEGGALIAKAFFPQHTYTILFAAFLLCGVLVAIFGQGDIHYG